MLPFVNWYAPISALTLSTLNGKTCCSRRQQACVWLLPVLITYLKTWRLGLPSTWQSDHLPGPSACNCTPPLLGPHFFSLYPLLGKILQFVLFQFIPHHRKSQPQWYPHHKLSSLDAAGEKKVSICATVDRRLQSFISNKVFSRKTKFSTLGCSGLFMTYASLGNPDLQRKASIWHGNQSTNYLAL